MIEIKPCRGCGRPLIEHPVANLAVRLETDPLDGSSAVDEIIAGRPLWMVDAQTHRVRPARPGEPGPLREHRCPVSAQAALSRPSAGTGRRPEPKSPSGGRTELPCGPLDSVLGPTDGTLFCPRCGTTPF